MASVDGHFCGRAMLRVHEDEREQQAATSDHTRASHPRVNSLRGGGRLARANAWGRHTQTHRESAKAKKG